jgi:hypothetical protein
LTESFDPNAGVGPRGLELKVFRPVADQPTFVAPRAANSVNGQSLGSPPSFERRDAAQGEAGKHFEHQRGRTEVLDLGANPDQPLAVLMAKHVSKHRCSGHRRRGHGQAFCRPNGGLIAAPESTL